MKKLLLLAIALLLSTNSFALSVDTHALQRKLKTFGYYSGAINGIIDDKTKNAIKQFLIDKEACPTYVDPETCRLLNEFQREFK